MSEIIGYTHCIVSGCGEVAEFKKDKRGKLFINCPTHGRTPGSTNKAQAEFQKMIDAGLVFEGKGEVYDAPVQPIKPEPAPEPEPENTGEMSEQPESSSNKKAGLAAITIGVILGGVTWWMKNQKQQA